MEQTNTSKMQAGAGPRYKVNDIGFRLILIPFFGIVIPLITGMIHGKNFSAWNIKFSFLYTIMIALIVWEGNRFLHFSLRSYFDWINKPVQKIAVLILSIAFYTVPISVLLLVGWYKLFSSDPPDWEIINQSTLIILIAVIFITHVYETAFMVKESESEIIKNEQLQRAKAEAELEALKNQIDPHFIFNSLNTLSYLIEEKPFKAKQFNDTLAEVYRYILQNKSHNLVLLREEIQFLQNYFLLLQIRFEKAVQLKIQIDERAFEEFLIPPISLQVLAENAIKHNEFSEDTPLLVELTISNGELTVYNVVRRKAMRKASSKIGLRNLQERYRLITSRKISVTETDVDFTVNLPIMKIA